MSSKLQALDRWMLWIVSFVVLAVVVINFITSYGHIYVEGMRYGEVGVDARLMPIGIDGMLLALGLVNLFLARFDAKSKLWRLALAFGVAGTVAANGAYGARWGFTGGLLSTWSPVALFLTVEAGLKMFTVAAAWVAQQQAQEAATITEAPKPKRPYTPRRAKPKGDARTPGSEIILKSRVFDPFDAGADLQEPAPMAV